MFLRYSGACLKIVSPGWMAQINQPLSFHFLHLTPRKKGSAPERENAHLVYRMEKLTNHKIFPDRNKDVQFFNETSISSIQNSVFMVKVT
jgi:hypothetical protein